jgi:4-amino-4-deoxy-L-arabinose transferase-like glycosyltransferase
MPIARHQYVWIALFALAVPAILALVFLPTPHSDTRELFDWGQFLSLSSTKQPPMMQWLGGLTEFLFAPTAFWAVFVTQVLALGGLAYVYATVRLLTDESRAAVFTLLFACSAAMVGAPLPFALNADILQFPFWAAIVYHGLRAARSDGLLHWLTFAVASAAAFYTKYTVVFLWASIAAASFAVPSYRQIWRNWRLYLAGAAFIALALPHLLAARGSGAIEHVGLELSGASLGYRAQNVAQIAVGVAAYLAPAWLIAAIALLRGNFRLAEPADPDGARLIRITTAAAFILVAITDAVLGHKYELRYDQPLLFLAVLTAATYIGFDPAKWQVTQRRVLQLCAILPGITLVVASLTYGVFSVHTRMQEPTVDAAAAIQAEWARHYSCGPAYVRGDFRTSHGIAIAFKPRAAGVPLMELHDLQYYDPALMKRLGAVVIFAGEIGRERVAKVFPGFQIPEVYTLTLPFVRTLAHGAITYNYFFIPPEACGAPKQAAGL